jgi:hypothetical protein
MTNTTPTTAAILAEIESRHLSVSADDRALVAAKLTEMLAAPCVSLADDSRAAMVAARSFATPECRAYARDLLQQVSLLRR